MQQNNIVKKVLYTVLPILFWIGAWYIIAIIVNKEVLIPSPVNTLERLCKLIAKEYFWQSTLTTMLRIIFGWFCGMFIGFISAFGAYYSKIVHSLAAPLVILIKATPVASFIILALIWIDLGSIPSFICALMVVPIIWSNVLGGMNSIDTGLLEMSRVYKIRYSKVFTHLIFPHMTPFFVSGAISSLGLAWKAGVAAEILCRPKNSIGKYIYDSKIYLETADLFAWTAVVVIMSLLLEKLLIKLLSSFGVKDGIKK